MSGWTDTTRADVSAYLKGKRVALVGSGPGVIGNKPGFVDSHDVAVRVNNYKTSEQAGFRTDVYYSFFGSSIRKTVNDLKKDGVKLCICKCPNAKFMDSDWHRMRRKERGVDFTFIYKERADFWFCPTYVPTLEEFMSHFRALNNHVPTTGFSALLDILSYEPESVYMTGFDFFASGCHNVNERWTAGDPADPIGHDPTGELQWVRDNLSSYPITVDKQLRRAIDGQDIQKLFKPYPKGRRRR